MTNHWIDIRNSDCILTMGSNPAENHPISGSPYKTVQVNNFNQLHIMASGSTW
jgi:formate dehydrogenase major subunit